VFLALRFSMELAGVFKYGDDPGPAKMALCVLLDGAGLVSVGMNGRVWSMVVITLDRFWKIVYPIHHRKYYRRWMLRVGLAVPWLSGISSQLMPTLFTSKILNGKCHPLSVWPSKIMLMVCWC